MHSFYLGTHQPNWLVQANVPLFVSHRRLANYVKLPRARTSWALDSGGFSEISMYGEWRTDPAEYVTYVDRYDYEIGNLDWAAPQDWMCEPWMVAKTGLSVRVHQERTVSNFLRLCELWDGAQALYRPCDQRSCPFMPILHCWTLDDYWTHIAMYARAGVRLADYPLVGLGSVCRRQATGEIDSIVRSVGCVLPLHAFGVKISGLASYGRWLTSADSMAWSFAGRREPGCAASHCSEANCRRFALSWRERAVAAADTSHGDQLQLFPSPAPRGAAG
jgi:hypothetical protein